MHSSRGETTTTCDGCDRIVRYHTNLEQGANIDVEHINVMIQLDYATQGINPLEVIGLDYETRRQAGITLCSKCARVLTYSLRELVLKAAPLPVLA